MPIDYKRYPPNWKTEIVPAVLERANNRCECCELRNGQIVFAASFKVQDDSGRYKQRVFWFRDKRDAVREVGYEKGVDQKKVVLTIAHLDHDEENHQVTLERLKALCQLCHLRYDAKEKYRRSQNNWKKKNPELIS